MVFRLSVLLVVVMAALGSANVVSAQTFLAEWSTNDIGRLGPTGLAVDTIGGVTYLYVADDVYGRIIKFNAATGSRVAVLGELGNGDGQFNRPFGVAVEPNSHDLFVVERGNNRVQRITNTGAYVMKWGTPGTGAGQFSSPIGVVADGAGNVYVSDYGNHRVQKFQVQGGQAQFVTQWGGEGTTDGRFKGPYGITLDPAGNVWVADAMNHRLQKFSATGGFIGTVGSFGTGNGQFVVPTWVTFDRTGAYYVTETSSEPQNPASPDIQNQRIQKFSATGGFLWKWGGIGEAGGQFRMPLTLALDASDNAYVSDYYNTRVQKISLTGGGGPPTGLSGARFVNLSSRLRTVDADASRAFIAGFVVSGSGPKQMLIRAVGPGLDGFNVAGALQNPKLRVFAGNQMIAENDDWSNDASVKAAGDRVGAFPLAASSRDAAVLVSLNPGNYSAQVLANGGDGVGLVEVYDAETLQAAAQLVNLSTRGFVETGAGTLAAGFVVTGDQPKRVLVRGIGPGLTQFQVTGALIDSQVKVFRGETLIAQNDNWSTPQAVAGGPAPASAAEIAAAASGVGAFNLPAGSKDAAVLLTLQPGAYSAVVSGANDTTGAGLVEVYELRN